MPILMPSTKTLTRSIENITKNGINIDEIVRNSIRCDIKGSLKKVDSEVIAKATRKVRVPLKETSLSCVAASPISNNCSGKRNLQTKTIEQKRKRCRTSCNRYPKKDVKTDGMKKENLIKEEPVDDSLTSLQWLTGVKVGDILEGRPIQYSPPSPAPSASSEDGDDKRFGGHNGYGPEGAIDYRKEKEVKPPYSYAVLIIMAMKSKTCGKMTLSEIYKWISENFVFYRNAEPTWQNSIRHNLSLNKCFAKIPRQKGDTGKGGYWTMVPEYANKLLENSIRKRRSNVYHYDANDVVKRQRFDVLESQLLCDIKAEMQPTPSVEEQVLPKTLLEDITLPSYDNSPVELKNIEFCRMDHSYGKSPVVNYNVSDVENIRAIATHLEDTTSNVGVCSEDISLSTHTTFSSTLRTDCIWSAEQNDNLSESMATVTEELLDAQIIEGTENAMLKTLNNSLNSSSGFDSLFYCLSPPISGDDDYYSDDLEDIDPHSPVLCDDDMQYLAIRGTSMTLFEPTPEITKSSDYDVKLEPSSPESIDLNE